MAISFIGGGYITLPDNNVSLTHCYVRTLSLSAVRGRRGRDRMVVGFTTT
jgi:hypothetical protein